MVGTELCNQEQRNFYGKLVPHLSKISDVMKLFLAIICFNTFLNHFSDAWCSHVKCKRLKPLSLIGSETLSEISNSDVIHTAADSAIQSFNYGVQSRFLSMTGMFVGNILAGIFVKFVADIIQKAVSERKGVVDIDSKPVKKQINLESWLQLAICVFIDVVGDSSFLIPGLGELEDVVWAPISAYALSKLFGSNTVTSIDFVKEILPGLDVVPVASLAWLLQNVYPESPITKALGINVPEQRDNRDKLSNSP